MVDVKIFQVVPYYPPHVGGMEFYVQYLSEQLAKYGNEVKVFTSSDKDFSYCEEVNGVEICRLKVSAKFYNTPIVSSLFMTLLKEETPDVLDAHQYPVYFSDVSALFSSLRKVPMFLHVHVIPDRKSVFSGFVLNSYYRTCEKLTLQASHCIIAPSFAYKVILTKMGVNPSRIKIVPYGVDLRRFNLAEKGENFKKLFSYGNAKVILTVGRLNYQKGFQYLLRAMPTVLRQIPNVKLVIVGNGELLSNLHRLSNSLGLGDNVIFTGSLPQASICEAYAASDLFVLPSVFESLGISLLRSSGNGKASCRYKSGWSPRGFG